MTSRAVAFLSILLAGCQSWTTIELATPPGSEAQVRQTVQAVSSSSGLLPCTEWGVSVTNADECFGGLVAGNRITVVTESRPQTYAVQISVQASGNYNKSELEALERHFNSALAQLFPPDSIVRTKTDALPEFQRLEVQSANQRTN